MTNLRIASCLAIILGANVLSFAQEFVDGVELTTTKAPWSMRILDNDLDITNVQTKPDEASAYFMMTSASSKLNVSVFIEPAAKCKTSEECRDHVLNLGNPAWGKFEQLAKGKIKDFYYFEFYRPEYQGQPVRMLDMYAQYVADGYWVDLHISKVLYTKADHALFEKVVNSVEFIPRKIVGETLFDQQRDQSRSVVSSFFLSWDKGMCAINYGSLASATRGRVGEAAWVEYCSQLKQDLKANLHRKLIGTAFVRSLPGRSDRPLAIHAFQSSFAGRESVVELVALLNEKDGNWKVTNYIPR